MTRRVASILPCLVGPLASALLLLTSAPCVSAQGATSATLRTGVTDPSGAVLPGAAVVLTNVRTTAVRTGRHAPTANVAADAHAACSGRAASSSVRPNSSRA